MKTKLLALTLAGASAFAFTPKPALASHNSNTAAVVGGVIGGLVIGSMIADSHNDRVVVASHRRHDDGYWKIIETRVWVPGCWVIERGYRGRTYRRYVEGHYEYRRERVWVSYDRHHRHRDIGRDHYHDRYDRDDRYGYRR